jgi:hypothetical protein
MGWFLRRSMVVVRVGYGSKVPADWRATTVTGPGRVRAKEIRTSPTRGFAGSAPR